MGYSIKHHSKKVSGVFVQYSWSYPIGVKTSDVKTSAGTLYEDAGINRVKFKEFSRLCSGYRLDAFNKPRGIGSC